MDGFTYHNLFETKGIEYLIIITFLSLLIPFWLALNKNVSIKTQLKSVVRNLTAQILRIPQGIFYSKNHTWVYLEKSGAASVGLNDLIQHITGEVRFKSFKNPDENIQKGDLLVEIIHRDKTLKIFAPISGKILETNDVLRNNPGYFNSDPYNLGWLHKIKPKNWVEETSSLFMAEKATDWIRKELQRFKDFLATSTSKLSAEPHMIILQEGGEIRDHILKEMPGEIWEDFQKEFLNEVIE